MLLALGLGVFTSGARAADDTFTLTIQNHGFDPALAK